MLLVQLIVLMVFIFAGLLFVLHHILTKNISSATTHLDDMSSDFLRREEDVKKRQVEGDKYYEEMVDKAKVEADKIRIEAEAKTIEQKDKILEEARITSEQIVEKAEKTKKMMANEIRQEMELRILSHIRELIGASYPKHIQEAVHRLWLVDLIADNLSQLSSMNIPKTETQIKAVSAFPLTASERAMLLKKFKDQFGRDFTIHEEVDASLIGGVLLTIGSTVLDGTIANKITQKIGEHV